MMNNGETKGHERKSTYGLPPGGTPSAVNGALMLP